MSVAKTFCEPLEQPAFPGGSVPGIPGGQDWHALEADAVVTELGVDPARGLVTSEVNKRHLRYGPNALQEIRPRPAWRFLVDQFASIVIALLAVAAAVAWITGDVLEAIAILVVLVINALVGFVTEWQAGRALDALRRQARTTTRVRRANITKFVHLMFSQNLGEVLMIFTAIAVGWPLPLLPLQILWMNLVTDVFPALALAVEPASPDLMNQPPRDPNKRLLSRGFMVLIGWQGAMLAALALAAYAWALQTYGPGAHSRTVALFAIIGTQLGHVFNCRSRTRSAFDGLFRNPFIWIAAVIVISLQLLAVYVSPLARVLGTVRPLETDWLIVILCSVAPVLIVETTKAVVRWKRDASDGRALEAS